MGLLTLLFSDRKEERMNRYQIDFPKIGIRPVIDGRRKGIRESLEEQTMKKVLGCQRVDTRAAAVSKW